MDKLKIYLAVLQKYHFWATCVLVLLVAVICWWVATAGLAGQFQKRKTKIEGDLSGVQRIHQNDPNEKVVDAIRDQEKTLKEKVWRAWEILYNEQKEKNPFPKVLGEGFKQRFENLKPHEELPQKQREDYHNFIKEYIPVLLDVVDILRPVEQEPQADDNMAGPAVGAGTARRRPGAIGPGLGGRNMGVNPRDAANDEQQWTGVVDWNENNIQLLENRFVWDQTPSTLAVQLAQEDLWVVGALLRVIARTNEGATGPASAAVKRIEAIEIGRDAVNGSSASQAAIFQPGAAAAGGQGMGGMPGGMMAGGGLAPGGMGGGRMPMGGMMGEMPGGMPGGMPGRGGMGGTMGGTSSDQSLLEGRYVDDKGMPLSATDAYPYVEHPYAEFKMMPIRMDLVVDQRRLPKLLVECANSSMPIEVRQVRVEKGTDGATRSAGRAGMAGPGMGGMGPMGPMGGMDRRAAVRTQDAPVETGGYDVPVEISGLIYIYNPPDYKKLGTGAASQENPQENPQEKPAETAAVEPEAPGAEPAAPPPAKTPNP